MTFITHGFRVSVVSDVRERVRDFRITFALYVTSLVSTASDNLFGIYGFDNLFGIYASVNLFGFYGF